MVKLRKANISDYKAYKILFEDKDFKYNWMYYQNIDYNRVETEEFFGDDLDEYIEEYYNYSFEKFQKDLQDLNIYIIEKDGNIKGYLNFFSCRNGTYKLAEWGMEDLRYDLKIQVLDQIKKLNLPKLRKILVMPFQEKAIHFFISNGFEKEGVALVFIKKDESG